METSGSVLAGNGSRTARRRRALFGELERPSDLFAHLGPNWFASVMGTGIVANAAILLPRQAPGQHAFALVVWVLAALLLLVVLGATAVHWTRHTATARGHALDPAMAPFYGAPPMAFMTVGAGTLLVGHDIIGMRAAIAVDMTLWTIGTLGGLLASAAVPYLMFTRHDLQPGSTFGSWLMPVVPPMVSAATGAALIAHLPAGQARLSLLLACYAMFGLSLVASLITITLVWSRLAYQHVGPPRLVPTLWIVLGPLGQSITAANLLANVAPGVIREPYATTLQATGILYGVPVWGFAALWFAIAAAITIRTARAGLPFSLTWWSFTFPVGTFVTGSSELATHSGSSALAWIAVGLYVFLLGAWLTVASRTVRNGLTGRLFLPPAAVASSG